MEEYMLNISPIDGRYYQETEEVRKYFSEYHLIENRIIVEIEWLKKLFRIVELKLEIKKEELEILNKIKNEFDINRSKKGKRNRKSYKT